MKPSKIQKVFKDQGFGFPLILLNVPMLEVRGEWVPQINQKDLQKKVITNLALKKSRLNGNEIRFIRLFAKMNLQSFAQRFDVSHPAVMKWEKMENEMTSISWSTEKDIRLFALNLISAAPKKFFETYKALETVSNSKGGCLKIDLAAS